MVDSSSASSVSPEEQEDLLKHGRAFREFVRKARAIECIYLEGGRSPGEVRAAAAQIRKALDVAISDVGGCAFGPGPLPMRLVFAGLLDVEQGVYSKILTPSQHKFGDQYETHSRRMIIGHALAVWDVVAKARGDSASVKRRIVDALNRAGFRVPVTAKRTAGIKSGGEVTRTTIEQWRKRAWPGKGPMSQTYRAARRNLEDLLKRLGARSRLTTLAAAGECR